MIKKILTSGKSLIAGIALLGAVAAPAAVKFYPEYAMFVKPAQDILLDINKKLTVADNETSN